MTNTNTKREVAFSFDYAANERAVTVTLKATGEKVRFCADDLPAVIQSALLSYGIGGCLRDRNSAKTGADKLAGMKELWEYWKNGGDFTREAERGNTIPAWLVPAIQAKMGCDAPTAFATAAKYADSLDKAGWAKLLKSLEAHKVGKGEAKALKLTF